MEKGISTGNNTIVAEYILHILSKKNKDIAIRISLINSWKRKDKEILKIFKESHNIINNEELSTWIKDSSQYLYCYRMRIIDGLGKMSVDDITKIMNDEKSMDNFISTHKICDERKL